MFLKDSVENGLPGTETLGRFVDFRPERGGSLSLKVVGRWITLNSPLV